MHCKRVCFTPKSGVRITAVGVQYLCIRNNNDGCRVPAATIVRGTYLNKGTANVGLDENYKSGHYGSKHETCKSFIAFMFSIRVRATC